MDPRNRRDYQRRAGGVELAGFLCLIAGVLGLANPHDLGESVLAQQLSNVAQHAWLACYAAGGALILAGLHWPRRLSPNTPRPELEGLGLWLLLGGMAINLLVLLTLRGPIPDGATATTVTAIVLFMRLCYLRLLDLERARGRDRRIVNLGPRARKPRVLDGDDTRDGDDER